MNNTTKIQALFLFVFTFFNCLSSQLYAQNGHFKIRSDEFIQVGYEQYKALTFGEGTGHIKNGHYAIEYWEPGEGLNFFKPWPTWNSQNYVLILGNNGNVAIGGTVEHNFKFRVYGRQLANNHIYILSDKQFKTNIKNLGLGLSTIMKLRPVSYQYNFTQDKYAGVDIKKETEVKQKTIAADRKNKIKPQNEIGLIAQEVKDIVPEIIGTDKNGHHSIQYTALIPVLIKALQEQQAQIKVLEDRIRRLEKK